MTAMVCESQFTMDLLLLTCPTPSACHPASLPRLDFGSWALRRLADVASTPAHGLPERVDDLEPAGLERRQDAREDAEREYEDDAGDEIAHGEEERRQQAAGRIAPRDHEPRDRQAETAADDREGARLEQHHARGFGLR